MFENLRAWIATKAAPPGMSVGIAPAGQWTAPKRGTGALLQAYSEMPLLRMAVNKIGRIIASTTWTLHVATTKGGKAIRNKSLALSGYTERQKQFELLRKQGKLKDIDEHPLLDLLGYGNSHQPGLVAMQTLQQHLDLVGEGFLVKVRGTLQQPTDLWPIPPTWVIDTPFTEDNDTGEFKLQYRAWSLSVPDVNMVWMVDPDMANPYGRGSGIARSLADELEADEFAAKHISAFFRNSARPDLLISIETGGKEAAKYLEQKWLEKFQGVYNRRRPLFTGGSKIDVKEIGQTFQEIQLVPLRQHQRDTIIQVYGFPPEVFGILQSSNRATITSASYLLAKYVLQPRLELLRAYFQEFLVNDFDERLILDFVSPVEEDKEHKQRVYAASPWAFRVDEHRALGGEEELENGEGKVYPLPFNLQFGQLNSNNEPTTAPEPSPTNDDNGSGDLVAESYLPPETRRRQMTKQLDENSLAILLNTLDDNRTKTSAWGISAAFAAEIVEEFGQRTLDQIGAEIEFQATAAVAAFQRTWATDRSKLIDPTTKVKLKEVLARAIENGDSPERMVTAIRDVYSIASRSRALLIARTETTRAAGFAANEGFKQAKVERKEWLSTRDDHVRDSHEYLDGQIVDANASFVIPDGPNAGATAQYPGDFGIPEEDINCRCAPVSVFDDEGRSVYSTEEKRIKAWKDFEAARITAERSFREVIKQSFNKQRDIVLAKFEELV